MTAHADMPILIVDDFQAMLALTRTCLKKIGFTNIDTANDGTEALKRMEKKHYSLVISDWNMEPMCGLTFLKAVRAQGNPVPFIMITAQNKAENILAAQAEGVSSYIVKPFATETLKNRISGIFGPIEQLSSERR